MSMKIVIDYIRGGNKISAIQEFKNTYNTRLLEAKYAVEDMIEAIKPATMSTMTLGNNQRYIVTAFDENLDDWNCIYDSAQDAREAGLHWATLGYRNICISSLIEQVQVKTVETSYEIVPYKA